ncbi:hypothetical protein HPB47_026938 [Ixodes persulcatus]|uniref:Uncharacterized protein n=1 Tax=Ixodes persulcatus TaxID=34615 RepID=A0AC60PZ08_IXOPE|nr:hypothetical protein HPB47_026938 [Ixodes persulcatus]
METDQLRLNEMAYLHVPDKERSKSPSPADSLASSATDISTLPIHDRSLHRGDGEHNEQEKKKTVDVRPVEGSPPPPSPSESGARARAEKTARLCNRGGTPGYWGVGI